MLRLTRYPGETIHVDGPCVIHIERIRGSNKVQLGIEADDTVTIVRGELIDGSQPAEDQNTQAGN